MYLKLALRNAKRSMFNYLLYITTMTILIAVMFVSNTIAIFGNRQAGFQTASLPLLIVVIMVALVNYINTFMMKQRAKEFATYLLLGMEKSILVRVFQLEFCFIGSMCFILGVFLGAITFLTFFSNELPGGDVGRMLILQAILQTLFFFCIVEILSAIRMGRKITKLQICELMKEERRNQSIGKSRQKFWGIWFCISFFSLILLLLGFALGSGDFADRMISFIAIPLISCIITFYQWLYAYLLSRRLAQADDLYQGTRLYRIAEMTTGTKTSAYMNSVFCICLFFAICSFVFGTLLLKKELKVLEAANQQWMGFLQISISIIFIVIYFSILSLQQMIELKQQAKNIRILCCMGKSQSQVKVLIKMQVMLKLILPTFMCFVLLLVGTPAIYYKMSMGLAGIVQDSLIDALGGFAACFAILYFCYYEVVCITGIRYLKSVSVKC